MNESTPPELATSTRSQVLIARKRKITKGLIWLVCAVPLLYILIAGWSAHQRSQELNREAERAARELQELHRNTPPNATAKDDAALYDMIQQTGSAGEMAVRLNYDVAVKRGLTCSQILANKMVYYGVPVAFAGKIERVVQNEQSGRKTTSAAMQIVASDSTCKDMLILAQCSTAPVIKEGEPGIIVGYLATNLDSEKINPNIIMVIARTILSHEQAAQYKLKLR